MTCEAAPDRRLCAQTLVLLALLASAPLPACAEEALFIRIRPLPEAGSDEGARAAREALWARRQAHARAIIETVCTGCLGPWEPAAEVSPTPPPRPMPARIADLTAPAGLETDTGSGASGPAPDSSTPERQP